MRNKKPPEQALADAVDKSVTRAKLKSKPDSLDKIEVNSLQAVAAAEEVLRANAGSIRRDSTLRGWIAGVMLFLLVIMVMFALVVNGFIVFDALSPVSPIISLYGPGGICLTLIISLAIMFRRK